MLLLCYGVSWSAIWLGQVFTRLLVHETKPAAFFATCTVPNVPCKAARCVACHLHGTALLKLEVSNNYKVIA